MALLAADTKSKPRFMAKISPEISPLLLRLEEQGSSDSDVFPCVSCGGKKSRSLLIRVSIIICIPHAVLPVQCTFSAAADLRFKLEKKNI